MKYVTNHKKIEMDSKINWVQIIENIKKYFAPIILYLGMIYFTFKKCRREKYALKT